MAYNDEPLFQMTLISLAHDLDLFVVGPTGKIFHPMFNSSEDTFSSNERVYIKSGTDLVDGIYTIHVRASKCVINECSSLTSLAVVGNVKNLMRSSSSVDWSKLCTSEGTHQVTSTGCICDDNFTGVFCQHEIVRINEVGELKVTNFKPYQTIFIQFPIVNNEGFKLGFVQNQKLGSFLYSLYGYTDSGELVAEYTNYVNMSEGMLTGDSSDLNNATQVFMNLTCTSMNESETTFYFNYSGEEATHIGVGEIAAISIVIVVVVVAVIVVLVVLYRKKARRKYSDDDVELEV